MTQVDLPNGEKSTFTYDALERLTQLKNLGSGNVNVSQYSYAYDNTNHSPGRISETSQVGTDVSTLRNYGYDAVNQLVSETVSQDGQTTQSKNYAYDQMGNRTQQTYQNSPDPLHTVSYTNNGLNQMTGVSNTDGTTTTQSTFTYDANGNTTQISGSDSSATQYTYDDADRLSSIVYKTAQGVNVSKSTFTYDGLSRLRISDQYNWDTQTNAWVQQSEKRRIYDGMDVIQERDGNNAVTNSYTRSGNIGGILAMIHYTPDGNGGFTSDKYFYHYDGRGNVTQLTNDSQNVVAKYTYDAFGNTTASGVAAELNQYRFSTKEEIKGLYYYGYRFYSPGLGRWINRDPIAEAGGINLYAFVGNNGVNAVDPYGRFIVALTIAAGAGIAAGLNLWGQIDKIRSQNPTLSMLYILHHCINWLRVGVAGLIGGATTAGFLALAAAGATAALAGGVALGGVSSGGSYVADTKLAGGTVNGDTLVASVGLGMISGGHGGLAAGIGGSITSKALGAGIATGLLRGISQLLDILGGSPIGVNSTQHGQSSPAC